MLPKNKKYLPVKLNNRNQYPCRELIKRSDFSQVRINYHIFDGICYTQNADRKIYQGLAEAKERGQDSGSKVSRMKVFA